MLHLVSILRAIPKSIIFVGALHTRLFQKMTRFTNVRKQAEANNYPLTCRLCSNKHPLRVCPIFRAKRPEERLRDVLIHRYCTNCLSGIHRAAHCTNPGRCRRCNEEHHTMLHIENVSDGSRRQRRSRRPIINNDSDDALSLDASEVGAESNAFRPDLEEEEMPVAGAETNAFRPDLEEGDMPETGAETSAFRPKESTGMESNALHLDSASEVELEPQRYGQLLRYEQRELSGMEMRTFQPRNEWHSLQTRRLNKRPRHRRQHGRVESQAFHLPPRTGFRSGMVQDLRASVHPIQALTSIAPTAVIKIEAAGLLHLVLAVIDACASRSIIAEDLARELNLGITAINSQRGYFIKLRGKHGQSATVMTHAISIKNYRKRTPNTSLDATVAAAYSNLKLADPRFHITAPVRLVLGAEVFPKILLGAIPAGTLGPLLAQNTIFGWVLSCAC
ncbi:PREDICTED: uncharacterized protein LOC108368786 [Rhagoletis zephyria]|uniref:uncharacterized protein LOC108368786 n=1 Tax=Rhagoletis zephyria TaxID=28612 RepID=UPI00081139C1|nr:PREDICTED: uncharacterized protein LOC108368786 [Rhagoletis zephyria]